MCVLGTELQVLTRTWLPVCLLNYIPSSLWLILNIYLFLFYLHICVCVPAHVYVHNMYLDPSETRVTSSRPPCELGTPTPALCKYNKGSIFAAEISLRPHPLYGSFVM